MYKITNVTDRNGNVKEDFIEEMRESHPDLTGEILIAGIIPVLCFIWMDDSGKMLRSSAVLDYKEVNDVVTITTRNSIYTLNKVH